MDDHSEAARRPAKRHGILCVVSGPSGSGKTTLCRSLAAIEPFYHTVSCTTRAQRTGEVHGRDYFFLSEDQFDQKASANEFLEHAVVHGRRYGTLRSEVMARLATGQDVIMDLDVQGAAQLRALPDEAVRRSLVDVFILPPSMADLQARLAGRKSESDALRALRLENARAEMRHWSAYAYTLISGTREDDLQQLRAIMAAERHRSTRLQPAINLDP